MRAHQCQVAERLGHVVVCAKLESADLVHVLGARSEHDDRHI
jgi:hypothetical protein